MSRDGAGATSRRAAVAVVRAIIGRPGLWPVALTAAGHLARPGWWHRPPYLPVPDDRLWAFRMETAYGRPDAVPTAEDVIDYLRWCRRGGRPGSTRRRLPSGHRSAGPGDDSRRISGAVQQGGPAKFSG